MKLTIPFLTTKEVDPAEFVSELAGEILPATPPKYGIGDILETKVLGRSVPGVVISVRTCVGDQKKGGKDYHYSLLIARVDGGNETHAQERDLALLHTFNTKGDS